jgi:hypothetical protein
MCLQVIKETNLNKSGYGWKVFEIYKRRVRPLYYYAGVDCYKINTWLSPVEKFILSDDNKNYLSGFHIFLNKDDADYLVYSGRVLRRVQYKQGHTLGTQNGPIIVARRMRILPLKEK